MIFVTMIPLIIGLSVCLYACRMDEYDVMAFVGSSIFGIATAATVLIAVNMGWTITSGKHIPEMISMYEEENNQIESQIGELVNKYMAYEGSTFKDLKNEDSVALVSLYPELKSDALVEKQIDVYVENNKKIRNLKKKQIELSAYKWWLYFGK